MKNLITLKELLDILGYAGKEPETVDLWEDQTSIRYLNDWCRHRHEFDFMEDINRVVSVYTDLNGFVVFVRIEDFSPDYEHRRDVIIKVSPAFTVAELEQSYIERGSDVYRNMYGDFGDFLTRIYLRNILSYDRIKKDYKEGENVTVIIPGDIWFGRTLRVSFPEGDSEFGVVNPANHAGRIYAYHDIIGSDELMKL